MFGILGRTRIALNRHIDVAEGHANNMRLYEATGMGAVLVTEAGTNLGQLFAVGEEVVVYDGADELVAVVRDLIADLAACEMIASAGRRRTLAEHSYEQRMPELAALLAKRF